MKLNSIKLGNRIISKETLPYIIAEIGVNHECSLKMAKKLVYLAKKGGADAAKFQTYKAHLITSKYAQSYWDTKKEKTKSQYTLFKKYDLFEKRHYQELSNYCKKIKIEFISTPFDHEAVDMLDKLVKFYKISSSDITNFPLLEKIASKKKPVIISTGASTLKEINEAINCLKKSKCKDIVILHCILNYPTHNKDANLNMISSLEKNFPKNVIGYSDHTLPSQDMKNLTTAYLLGARVIEKHFTIDKKMIGNDHYHSMDFKDLKKVNNEIKYLKEIIGKKEKTFLASEKNSRKFARRSLVARNLIKKNQIIKIGDLICKRPGTGLKPAKINSIVGKKAKRNLVADHVITHKDIK